MEMKKRINFKTVDALARLIFELGYASYRVFENGGIRRWEDLNERERDFARYDVEWCLDNIGRIDNDEDMHNAYVEFSKSQGWTLGSGFSLDHKTAPNIMSYAALSSRQKMVNRIEYSILKEFISQI